MNIDLSLSPQHLDYIFNVLAQRPWAEANPIILELQKQVQRQQTPDMFQRPQGVPNGHDQAN